MNDKSKLDELVDSYEHKLIEDLSDLLKIRSVYESLVEHNAPFGKGNRDALKHMLALCEKEGFRTKNLDGYAGYAEYGEGEEMIAVLSHLDTVPEGNGWTFEPFAGTLSDGKLYGRGVSDNKGPAIISLYALKAIKESSVKINKRIRLIFGTDEELGSKCIRYYLEKEEIPQYSLVPDADFPVTNFEKGMMRISIRKSVQKSADPAYQILSLRGGQRANVVPNFCELKIHPLDENEFLTKFHDFNSSTGYDLTLEKNALIFTVTSTGVLAHGSTPELGVNAIYKIMIFLHTLKIQNGFGHLAEFFAENIGMDTSGVDLGISASDETGELSLNTGIIKVDGSNIYAEFDVRYPRSATAEKITRQFREKCAIYGIDVYNVRNVLPLDVSENSYIVKSLLDVYSEYFNAPSKAVSIGFGTYTRLLPNAVGFGPNFPWEEKIAHKSDEFMTIKSILDNTKLYARALYKLASD